MLSGKDLFMPVGNLTEVLDIRTIIALKRGWQVNRLYKISVGILVHPVS